MEREEGVGRESGRLASWAIGNLGDEAIKLRLASVASVGFDCVVEARARTALGAIIDEASGFWVLHS